MAATVQVKCARCLCIASFEVGDGKDDEALAKLNRTGKGMPRNEIGLARNCPCICHSQTGQITKLVSRVLDFGDDPPF